MPTYFNFITLVFYFSFLKNICTYQLKEQSFISFHKSLLKSPIEKCNKNVRRHIKYRHNVKLLDESIKNNEHIIQLTPAAEQKISELVQSSGDAILILKLLVTNGGCKGLQYKLNPITKVEIEMDDYIQQFPDLKFILAIDATSVIYVFNNTLDYSTDLINGGFKFINPNASKKCGCGKSFNV